MSPKASKDETVEAERAAPLPSTQLLLAGLLALQIHESRRDGERTEPQKAEVTLADLGMTLGQIATLTGRNYETVKTTIRRARARQAAVPAGSPKQPSRQVSDLDV